MSANFFFKLKFDSLFSLIVKLLLKDFKQLIINLLEIIHSTITLIFIGFQSIQFKLDLI